MYQKLEDLNTKTVEELVTLMASIPSSVTTLDLSENDLGNKTDSELAALFAAIPPTISSLKLNGNQLSNKAASGLVTFFSTLPATVRSLDLSANNLHLATGAELKAFINAIPATVTALNLTGNHLGSYTGAELVELLAALPISLTSLDLGLNCLNQMTANDLAGAIRAIPASITSLNLGWNNLFKTRVEELALIMAAIPATVTSLGLMGNFANKKSQAKLVACLAAIPATLRSLDLSKNNLSKKVIADLEAIAAGLPASVSYLNLDCIYWSADKIAAILKAAPLNVEMISLGNKIITINDYFANQLLAEVTTLSTAKSGVERLAFDTIKPAIEICGSRLNRFIDFLEKQNNSIADLTCGLLLDGQIATTSDILENCSEFDQNMEKRTHDAISFYTKAARDPAIKPMVEFLLRNIRLSCPSQSVQNRLAFYDLAPEDKFNCELNQALKNRFGVAITLLASFGVFSQSSAKSDEVRVATAFEFC